MFKMAKSKNEETEKKEKFRWSYAVFVVIFLMIAAGIISGILNVFSGGDYEESGNVAVIGIKGEIVSDDGDSFLSDDVSSSTDIIELIEKAGSNPEIKAIIFEINSPGGSAVASAEIADAIKRTNKTTVAWIREVGASGGYWIASSTDYVVANRASITGSIGVIASYLEFDKFIDRYNITYRRLISGKYKDIGSPFREMSGEEQEIFQKDLDSIRDYFIDEVAKNRKMKKSDVEKLATGMFFLGAEAKSLGLVDELGGKQEALSYIEKKEGITAELTEYKTETSLLDLLTKSFSKQSFYIGRGIGKSLTETNTYNKLTITS